MYIFLFFTLFYCTFLEAFEKPNNGTYQEFFDNNLVKYEISFKSGKKHGQENFGMKMAN